VPFLCIHYPSELDNGQLRDHLKVTRIAVKTDGRSDSFDLHEDPHYNLPAAGSNSGQLASLSDGVNGETVAYQYDALKRLISATAVPNTGSSPTAWTEAYGYDGFGNLTSKSLNEAPGAIDVDPTNNKLQVASIRYDANGNLLAGRVDSR
jgi:YD repeat-containing protein